MRNSVDELRFGPDRRLGWSAVAGALLFTAVAVLDADAGARVLATCAAVLLATLGGTDLVFAPRLVAGAGGLAIRTLTTRRRITWDEVERFAVDEHGRYGLTARALEIDAGAHLVVLGRHSLGRDPRDVHAAVLGVRGGVTPE